MCGIAALIGSSNPLAPKVLENFLNTVAHRGPDDEGYVGFSEEGTAICWGGASTAPTVFDHKFYSPVHRTRPEGLLRTGMGCRRLAITDSSAAGHQPFSTPDGRLWLVFNGQIYNYQELRVALEQLGQSFRTECDSEVLLGAYAAWGENALDRLNGQFAFVVYDRIKSTFFAARDRFGIKPLYYTQWNDTLCFASEIKQFTRLPGWKGSLDHQRAFEFLRWGYADHSAGTLFGNVSQIAPGHCLAGRHNLAGQRRWYYARPQVVPDNFPEAADVFRQLLSQALSCRASTNQPLALSLSGGIDSTALAVLLKRNVHSFTARSEDPRLDEYPLVQTLVAEQNQITPHFCTPQIETLLQEIDQLVWHQDEPFNGTSLFAEWSVFKLARQAGIRVSLEGHGSDEYLLGYTDLFGPYFIESWRRGRWHKCIANLTGALGRGFIDPLALLAYLVRQLAPEPLLDGYRSLRGNPTRRFPAWLTSELKAEPVRSAQLGTPYRSLREMQRVGLGLGLLHQLHWADRSSMAHSIESRVPYLDYRLVEFSLSLPTDFLFRSGQTKAILRQAVRGQTPPQLLERGRKIGYATAERDWVQHGQPQAILQLCRQAVDSSQGIFNSATLSRCKQIISGHLRYDPWIWRVISFGLWMKKFQVELTPQTQSIPLPERLNCLP